jgi:predicted Zn-dependent peptidase
MLEYMGQQYVPSNVVMSVAGDVSHQEVVEIPRGTLGEWHLGVAQPWHPAHNGQDGPRWRVTYRNTEQAHISLAVRGFSSTHPDRYALDLLNVVLGEGMSSRLFLEVRENRGLAYDVHSYVTHFLDAGAITVYAGVHPKQAYAALQAIWEELARLPRGVPEAELQKAKEFTKGRLLLRMEDSRSVCGWMGGQELLLGQIRSPEEVVALIDSVTPEDLGRVAAQLLMTDKLNLAVVGPFRGEGRFVRLLKL